MITDIIESYLFKKLKKILNQKSKNISKRKKLVFNLNQIKLKQYLNGMFEFNYVMEEKSKGDLKYYEIYSLIINNNYEIENISLISSEQYDVKALSNGLFTI